MSARAPLFVVFAAIAAMLAVGATSPVAAQQATGQGVTAALLQPLDASEGGGGGTAGSAGAAASSAAAMAPEQGITVKLGGKETLSIKGFLSATFYAQDANFDGGFGNGQNAEWPTANYPSNKWFNGGDVRNSRLTFAFDGPETADGWKMGALLETDFFGGFNGAGGFSQQQAIMRIRLAYTDLSKGGTTLRIGQFWSPFFGEVPESLSHIAFPLGYGSAGMVGWRFPGVFLYQKLTPKTAKTQMQLDLAAMEGSWNGPATGELNNQTFGNVGFRGQFDAKLNFFGKDGAGNAWKLYVAGHYDQKSLNGVGNAFPAQHGETSLNGTGAEIGGSYKIGPFLIHGNIYTTKADGQNFAAITQFGDIKDTGGWLQLGYDFTKRWSGYLFYGEVNANRSDVLQWVGATGRQKNEQEVAMVEWSLGQYQLGLEWLHDDLTLANSTKLKGNQIAVSTRFFL
jgi:hypothetical protein